MFDIRRLAECSQEIISAGQFLYGKGWSPATSSNYSSRIDWEHVAITVSGKHKGELTPRDIMVVDLKGRPVASEAKPSAETLLHTVIYQEKPEVGAVLHTHSVCATVVSRYYADRNSLELQDYELQKAFAGITSHEGMVNIPIYENTQDIGQLSEDTRKLFLEHPECPGYLIRGHGVYTWGQTMQECLRHIEAMEFLLSCELEMLRIKR
ncbi:methylthioribulose-1-phosphate dehydratase [Hahella sp. CCB-MM4]|uniref:methylthioribulose 1-phosphate dehydratase n=1 Tax=Hahella sp. (strain CCB-MM4) TaxID=1926491 RepID=UPI000B9B8822|nr:methylthioribulose 1-phosphate dehydratase [Hahella sp. CCB-MM4]OZG72445.1 methylthioribulose-1-phosphate dehydratase [Hahella sp. CCB-MM4]